MQNTTIMSNRKKRKDRLLFLVLNTIFELALYSSFVFYQGMLSSFVTFRVKGFRQLNFKLLASYQVDTCTSSFNCTFQLFK